jgi:hypothetical protein
MRLRIRLSVAVLFAALVVAGVCDAAERPQYAHTQRPIAVSATPVTSFDNRDSSQLRFGALEFRGGLQLNSKSPAFGGISALRMDPDGSRFVAVTDKGSWLRGRIVYENGRPSGIADAEMAPLLGAYGAPLAAQGRGRTWARLSTCSAALIIRLRR